MLFGKEVLGTILVKLYKDLTSALEDIHSKKMLRPENRLLHVVEEYYKKCGASDIQLQLGTCSIDKICALQMTLWNSIYYNFYEKNVSFLCNLACLMVIWYCFTAEIIPTSFRCTTKIKTKIPR